MKITDIDVRETAKAQGVTVQAIYQRISRGWLLGKLNGVVVMYSPKHAFPVVALTSNQPKGEQHEAQSSNRW